MAVRRRQTRTMGFVIGMLTPFFVGFDTAFEYRLQLIALRLLPFDELLSIEITRDDHVDAVVPHGLLHGCLIESEIERRLAVDFLLLSRGVFRPIIFLRFSHRRMKE